MTAIDQQTPSLDELWTMLKDQQATIETQQAEIEALETKLQLQESDVRPRKGGRREPTSRQPRDGRLSRAGLLKGAVAGLSGVAAAELAGTIGASPAAAATDTNFVASGGTETAFRNSAGYLTGANLSGTSAGVVGGCYGGTTADAGVLGFADGSAPNGSGIKGDSFKYIGIIGRTQSGDHTGIWGYNTANGGWGLWGATYNGYPDTTASNLGNGVGVRGESAGGTGVHGTSVSSYGGHFSGGLAPLLLDPASSAGPPATGTHAIGEIVIDASGTPWVCVSGGTPGSWSQVLLGDPVTPG